MIVSRSLPLISVSSYAISRHNLPLGIPFRDQELADQHARVTGARARAHEEGITMIAFIARITWKTLLGSWALSADLRVWWTGGPFDTISIYIKIGIDLIVIIKFRKFEKLEICEN